ncbi:MAG: MCP four helix bundle domain-containing protein, partial [Planctomycetaceae bacterium]|nr:MCP four helix bundle domain-containing protein [Planctomycetaceae bacterium]
MLNKMKISSKLTVGFLTVLFLLVAVGVAGYWAIESINAALERSMQQLSVSQSLGSATDNIYLAQTASAYHVVTKDTAYSDLVTKRLTEALKFAKETQEVMRTEKNKTEMQKIIKGTEEFVNIDNELHELTVKSNKENENVLKLSEDLQGKIHELIALAYDVYAGFEKEGKPLTMVHVKNYAAATSLLEDLETIRRQRRDLIIILNNPKLVKEREEGLAEINKQFDEFTQKVNKLGETFVSEKAKKMIADIVGPVKQWQTTTKDNVADMVKQSALQDRLLAIGKEAEESANTLISNIDKTVADLKESSAQTVSFAANSIIVLSVVAVIVGIICALVLTTNITSGIKIAVNMMKKIVSEGDLTFEIDQSFLRR